MKIGLYSPFLAENIGGGERYLLTVAECLLSEYRVDLIVQPHYTKKKIAKLKKHLISAFNLKLNKLNIITGPFSPNYSSQDRKEFTKDYDIFYYMTDGSFFISKAKRNAVYFMIPFNNPPKFFQKLKLNSWKTKVSVSLFAKQVLEKNWKIKIDYIHGGVVDPQDFKPLPKKNLIIHVGRFFSTQGNKHCKKQDFLVKTFKKMCDQGLKNWQLVLIGPIDKGRDNQQYFNQVKKLAQGYPITINSKVSFQQLQKQYGQAKIYWHATGYGINENINPQAVEHLGISTIEAMSAGAVPIVINKGGQPEIVAHNINGLLWQTQDELINYTNQVIDNPKLQHKLAKAAQERSRDFSKARFCQTTKKIFKL